MLGKYVFITPQKSKLKNFQGNFYLSKKEVCSKLPVQKTTGRTGSGLVPDWKDKEVSGINFLA